MGTGDRIPGQKVYEDDLGGDTWLLGGGPFNLLGSLCESRPMGGLCNDTVLAEKILQEDTELHDINI